MSELFNDDFEWDPHFSEKYGKAEIEISDVIAGALEFWDDEALLETPADRIVQVMREASMDGREYICGDVAPTSWAVVRVPDEEAMLEDFKPRLTWDQQIDAPPSEDGQFHVNLTLANKAIPPRIVEPSLPPQTKLSMHDAHVSDAPLPPLERALLRGCQTIQLIQKAHGEHDEIAKALGKTWGDEALFASEYNMDLIGDVSLQRVLARAGKRRFEILRNIGWTSIVTAGMTTANTKAYGEAAIINWQRRTELAKFFLHVAIALEGKELVPGTQFGITARIPAFSVMHRTWDDIALYCDSSKVPIANLPEGIVMRARNFLREGLRDALRIISDAVRAKGEDLEWNEANFYASMAYDQLTFLDPITLKYKHTTNVKAHELAFDSGKSDTFTPHGTFKAHDLRTALVEMAFNSEGESREAMRLSAMLTELAKLKGKFSADIRARIAHRILPEFQVLQRYANLVIQRPKEYELRNRRAEWGRIAKDQFPLSLFDPMAAYSAKNLTLGTLFTCMSDDSSQAARTARNRNHALIEAMSRGVRTKKEIILAVGKSVITQLVSNLLVATRGFYRERYRCRAKVKIAIARELPKLLMKLPYEIEAAGLWARADHAHYVCIKMDKVPMEVYVPKKRQALINTIYAANLAKFGMHEIPETKGQSSDDIALTIQKTYVESFSDMSCDGDPFAVFRQMDLFLERFGDDVKSLTDGIKPDIPKEIEVDKKDQVDVEQTMDLLDVENRVRNFSSVSKVQDMVFYWVYAGKLTGIADPDETDTLIEWMKENISEHVDDVDGFVTTHSKDLDTQMAAELYDDWVMKMLDAEDALAGCAELK